MMTGTAYIPPAEMDIQSHIISYIIEIILVVENVLYNA
jgi:hypothetical protein